MPRTYKPKRARLPEKYEPGFLSKLDGRTEISRMLRANLEAVIADLGGEDNVSHMKQSLAERFVFLEALLGKIEADMAKNPNETEELIGKWIQAVNSLTGIAKTLGLDRQYSNQPWKDHGKKTGATG